MSVLYSIEAPSISTSTSIAVAYLQSILLHQLAVHVLDLIAHICELDSRLDDALRVVAHLALHFGGLARSVVLTGVQGPLFISVSSNKTSKHEITSRIYIV